MEGYLASVSLGEESTQMWSLNKRLEAYLSRVKALEEENELLRKEIHSLRSSKSERCWKKKHHKEMMKLRDALDDGHREMVQAEMVRDSIYEEIEFVKQRCLEEKQAREDAKKELSESKKLLEEETRAQIWLKERLGQLEAELEDILRDHEEEKALMEEEIASFSQRLENFRVAPVAFKPVEVDDYARKLSEIWQGAVEEYKSEVSVLEAGLSESKENLRKVLEENKQNRLLLQSLDKELVSLKMRKEALEDLLSKQWQEQKEEEEKLQLEAEALEQEKQDLRGQIAEVLEDRQQLMHLKMSLSLEVATYRSLLEAESTRIYTDYRGSCTFNDSMLEHNNVRRRQSEDTRKTVSKDHRQSYSKKQIGDKNELQRPSLNNFSTVKSSAVPVRTSPVTKEFQKVSSVLQSQDLKYTKAPQLKEVQTVSTVKSNLETRTFSGDAFRRAQVETRKTDEQVIKKDALGLNDLNKNTGFKEEKDIQKPGFMDHVVSKSVSSTEHKVPEIDPLESALKSLEEDLSSVSSTFNAGQSSNLEAIKDVLGEPICLENLQNEIAFEKESPGTNAEADPIEEVISESVSYQTVHFEKQELSNLLEIENTHENHVQDATQAFNSCEQDGHDRASTLENNEPHVQQYIRTLESNEIKESKIPSDNNEEAEIISKSRKVFLENEYIPVSKDDLTEFTSHLENDSESSQSFDSKLFENKSTEDQLITNLKSNTQENIFQSNQEHLENLEFDSVVPDTVKFMYPQENNLLEEENVYGDGELVQMATDENIINQSSDQLLLSDHSHHEETKTSESIAVEHNRMESEHAEVDKSSEIPVEISENVSVEEIIHEISDVEEDTKQAFEDERVGVHINQNNQESTVDLDGPVYSQEENSQLEEDEVSISEEIEKDFEINQQECLKSDQIREAFDTEEVDHQVVDFMQEMERSFEREVGQLNNIKQEVDYVQNDDEDSFQNNYDEPQELESCDLEEQKIKLEEENQLSENEGNQNFGGNDIEEFSQQGYDTDELCQETIGNQVSAQLLCESDINQDKLSMEDEEEQNNPETEDNIGLEQESDQENTRSDEGTKFSQEECDVVFKPEDMSDKSEYSGQQEDLDKQVTDFSLNEQANNDLLEKEEVILHHADDQRSVNDEITIDEKLSERLIDNELATVDVNESLAANKEQVDLFTDEYAVDDNVGMQDDDSGQYQTKEDLFVDGNNIIEKIEIQQTSLLNQEICERVDNVDEDISGEAKNESVEMNDVVDLVPEAKVTGDEQISPLQDEKLNLETMEDTKDNDGQLCLEKENETEYIEVTDSPQFATDLSHDAGRELTVDQNSANLQFCENPTETLIAHHIEYETVADSDLESTEEQVQETEHIPFKPEESKMENENSDSEESVDSQEISLNSHKSEEFEISKDYQLEQTLPDATPLPNLEDEFEDLTEQPDSNIHEEHQNNDDSGASTFIISVGEDKEREVIESVSKDEESNEEEFGDLLSVDKTSQEEVTTLSGLAQELSYLGDNEESKDSMENAEILNENPSNDIVDFMVSQMTETKIIIAEQVTEQTVTEVTLQFDDAPNKRTENHNVREKETYDYESNEENIEFTNENQSASPANDIVDENQSEDSVISDNEGTTFSYEDLPNATSISHVVALEESSISTTEQSSTDTKRMTYEGYEITSLQNVEENAQETEKEFPSGLPLEQEDSRSEDEELDDQGSEFSFGVNDEKANGEHKDVGEDDETEDMLNGHSQTDYSKIVLTSKKSFEMEEDVLDTQDIPEDSIIKYAMSEAKSEGLFQSLLETSEPKDGSRIEEVLLSAESKKVTISSEYLEFSEEDRLTMLVQNPYLNDKTNKDEPKTVAKSLLVDEELLVSANQQINNEKYEGVLVTKTLHDDEDSWSSDD